jgi:hypothetical protein
LWFSVLFDRDHRGTEVDIQRKSFPPKLLLRLTRLAFQHVRIADDARHEGAYSMDERDYAEQGRSAILDALFATTGNDGWAAKLELSEDPLFGHLRDRIIAIAKERAAEEADSTALSEAEFADLDAHGEAPATTRDDMFEIMRDRLDDIEDLLLQDVSPRELWASTRDERVMRRELAGRIRDASNRMYTVDQESATADEKETDIRLRSTASSQQAVIELKIGEKPRTASDLRDTVKQQLVKKYMPAEECRAGCLIITIASSKSWTHPENGDRLDFSGLISFLNDEAERVFFELAGAVRLMVRGLDLRPRLPTEKVARLRKAGKKKAAKSRSKLKKAASSSQPPKMTNRKRPKVKKSKAKKGKAKASRPAKNSQSRPTLKKRTRPERPGNR